MFERRHAMCDGFPSDVPPAMQFLLACFGLWLIVLAGAPVASASLCIATVPRARSGRSDVVALRRPNRVFARQACLSDTRETRHARTEEGEPWRTRDW